MEAEKLDARAAALRKQKKKKLVNLSVLGAVVLLLAVGGYLLVRKLSQKETGASVTTYRATAVSEGEVSSVISGSGTLSAVHAQSVAAAADMTVETVEKQPGDSVAAGDILLTLSSDTLSDELDALNESLEEVREELADTAQYKSTLTVTAPEAGRVKLLVAEAGDLVDSYEYLCLISTDGKMKLTLSDSALQAYDAVTVTVGDDTEEGIVTAVNGQEASVVIENNAYDMGTEATVYDADGNLVGTGELGVNEFVTVTQKAGRIAEVCVAENQKVAKKRTLFKLEKGAPTDDYQELKAEEADLLEQITDITEALTVTAEYDGVVTQLSVKPGEEIASGTTLCEVAGSDGYEMTLSIDELDISSVKQGQTATVTLDALEGEFSGTVDNISYSGSGSYVTTYTVTVVTDPIDGALPGMSASAEIITETSGLGMVVSVNAVQYDGDETFVYLAGDGVSRGDSKTADELDLTALTRAAVVTGMSDGTYIAITSDALSVGDLIWVPQVTTTETYTADDSVSTTFSGMGGMGGMGGQMPSGGMPDFGGGGNMGGGNMGGQRPRN